MGQINDFKVEVNAVKIEWKKISKPLDIEADVRVYDKNIWIGISKK